MVGGHIPDGWTLTTACHFFNAEHEGHGRAFTYTGVS